VIQLDPEDIAFLKDHEILNQKIEEIKNFFQKKGYEIKIEAMPFPLHIEKNKLKIFFRALIPLQNL
jgi:hypothetical protein